MTLLRTIDERPAVQPAAVGENTGKDAGALGLTVVVSESDLQALRAEWTGLTAVAPVRVYQTFEWLSLWWEHLGRGKGRSLHILVFRRPDGSCAGILPLFLENERIAGVTIRRTLQFLGSGSAYVRSRGIQLDDGPSDYCDAIVHPGAVSEVAEGFVRYLRMQESVIDGFAGVEIPGDSIFLEALVNVLGREGIEYSLTDAEQCSEIRLRGNLTEYLSGLSASVRRRLTQAYKAAGPGGEVEHVRITNEGELREAFQSMADLHQARWNSLGYPGLFWDPRSRRFQEEAAVALFRNDMLWFVIATFQGRCVASRCGFRFKNRYYDYLTGFTDGQTSAKARPGLGLLLRMIDDAFAGGADCVDLLRGDESYKADLTDVVTRNRNIRVMTGEHKPGNLATMAGLLWYVPAKEWLLLRVQLKARGWAGFLPGYFRFRFLRLRHKVESSGSPATGASKERETE
jgi:CelD/BcsL family acetyltransferase involved in cellulose biosynthesis